MSEMLETERSLEELRGAAGRAVAGFDWELGVVSYGQALSREDLSPEAAYALLDGRAEAQRYLGNLQAEADDLEAMAGLAGELDDPVRGVEVMHRQVQVQIQQGRLAEAQKTAEAALGRARELGDLPEGEARPPIGPQRWPGWPPPTWRWARGRRRASPRPRPSPTWRRLAVPRGSTPSGRCGGGATGRWVSSRRRPGRRWSGVWRRAPPSYRPAQDAAAWGHRSNF